MAMAIDSTTLHELDFSGYTISTTTATSSSSTDQDQYICNNWNEWSPMVDWEALSGPQDFQDLIESMMDDDCPLNHHIHHNQLGGRTVVSYPEPCCSTSSGGDETNIIQDDDLEEDTKGLRLVHLLMAAAEALTGGGTGRELAQVILVRLKEMVSPTDGSTNMERLASYFTDALQSLLENPNSSSSPPKTAHHHHHKNDILAAFQLLQDMSPYVKFGHFTANQAILDAVTHDRRIHIIDYDIMEGIQWAPLIQSLSSRNNGSPAPHLRITALTRPGGSTRKSMGTVQETGRRLTAFAASLNQPFSFHQCRLDPDETFRPSSLKLVRGEALIINCILHLPHFNSHRSSHSVKSFLSGSKEINPRLVTLVEEEMGPPKEEGFVGMFMDSLHHYSAVCDSLEAGFPMQGQARALVERVFLGPMIVGSVARVYNKGKEEATSFQGWWEWLGGVGFRPAGISFANHCQAKLLLGLFNDGYRVEEFGSNRLVLGWKSRRFLSASVWTSPSSPLSLNCEKNN